MPTVEGHLRFALAQLQHEQAQLYKALDVAIARGYDQPWLDAIDKALRTNLEAITHLINVLANIRHPSQPPYGLKPGMVRPRRG